MIRSTKKNTTGRSLKFVHFNAPQALISSKGAGSYFANFIKKHFKGLQN